MLQLLQAVAGRPWAIRSDLAIHVQGLLTRSGLAGLRHLASLKDTAHEADQRGPRGPRIEACDFCDDDAPQAARGPARAAAGRAVVGIVTIYGTLTQRGDVVNSVQTRSTDQVAAEVQAMALDGQLDAIVLDVDSPGGEVYGVPEAWAAISAAAKLKPIVAAANSQAASAALYLASAATEIYVTPSGEVGSVGVYALHVNAAKALQDAGEEWEFVVADDSPFKVESAPTGPLSDDARGQIKKSVNRYMETFVRDLATGRGVSAKHAREQFGGGRMLGPQEAVAARLADRVGTLQEAIRRAAALGAEQRDARKATGRPPAASGAGTAGLLGTL